MRVCGRGPPALFLYVQGNKGISVNLCWLSWGINRVRCVCELGCSRVAADLKQENWCLSALLAHPPYFGNCFTLIFIELIRCLRTSPGGLSHPPLGSCLSSCHSTCTLCQHMSTQGTHVLIKQLFKKRKRKYWLVHIVKIYNSDSTLNFFFIYFAWK